MFLKHILENYLCTRKCARKLNPNKNRNPKPILIGS